MITRRLRGLLLVLSFVSAVGLVVPTVSSASTDRTQDVGYQASASDRNGWSASVQGEIEFYSGYRQFKVFGDLTLYMGSDSDTDHYVYIKVRQDVANTVRDGRWYVICPRTNCDRYLDHTGFGPDEAWYYVVGRDNTGAYISDITSPGHGLKGLRLRVCHLVVGPDVCGPRINIDNPYN